MPTALSPFLLEGHNLVRLLFSSIVLLLILIFKPINHKLQVSHLKVLSLFMLFYLLSLLSSIWAFNTSEALYRSQLIFTAIAFGWLLLQSVRSKAVLLNSIFILSLISIVYYIVELSQMDRFDAYDFYKVHNFFIHKNLFSSFLFLLLILSLYVQQFQSKARRTFSLLMITLLFVSVISLQNRNTYIALAVVAIAYSLLSIKWTKKITSLVAAGIVLSACLVYSLQESLLKQSIFSLDSFEERIKLWSKTIDLIKYNLWFGVGSGNWQFNYAQFSVNDIYMIHQNINNFQHAHNEYLQLFSENGLVGLLLVAMAIVYWARSNRHLIHSKQNRILVSGLIGLAFLSFFSFPFNRLLHLFVIIGIFFLIDESKAPLSKQWLSVPSYFKWIVWIGLGFNILLGSSRVYAQINAKKLVEHKAQRNFQKMIFYGEKANHLLYQTDPTSTPIASYLGFAHVSLKQYDRALYYFEQAYEIAPYDFEVLSNYGSILIKYERFEKAKQILDEAYRINKYNDPIKYNLATFELKQNNYAKALYWLNEIPNCRNKYPAILDQVLEQLR